MPQNRRRNLILPHNGVHGKGRESVDGLGMAGAFGRRPRHDYPTTCILGDCRPRGSGLSRRQSVFPSERFAPAGAAISHVVGGADRHLPAAGGHFGQPDVAVADGHRPVIADGDGAAVFALCE